MDFEDSLEGSSCGGGGRGRNGKKLKSLLLFFLIARELAQNVMKVIGKQSYLRAHRAAQASGGRAKVNLTLSAEFSLPRMVGVRPLLPVAVCHRRGGHPIEAAEPAYHHRGGLQASGLLRTGWSQGGLRPPSCPQTTSWGVHHH